MLTAVCLFVCDEMNFWIYIFPNIIFYFSLEIPKIGDASNAQHRMFIDALMQKNVSQYSESEIGFFLSFKESQYSDRGARVEQFCGTKPHNFGRDIVKNSLIYDPADKVSYCQIAKVASSSWCNHFIKLGKTCSFSSFIS